MSSDRFFPFRIHVWYNEKKKPHKKTRPEYEIITAWKEKKTKKKQMEI